MRALGLGGRLEDFSAAAVLHPLTERRAGAMGKLSSAVFRLKFVPVAAIYLIACVESRVQSSIHMP